MLLPSDNDSLYAALMARDPACDGFYYAGVKSTGAFCRLTCPARKPKRANVVFFPSTDDARNAGCRACLRCKPLDRNRPTSSAVDSLRERVRASPETRWTATVLAALGYNASTIRRAFKPEYGVTFAQFTRSHRLGFGVSSLRNGASVIEAQLDAGYESASGFRDAITKLVGEAPVRTQGCQTLSAQWLDTPIGAMLAIADETGMHLLEFGDRKALPGEITRLRQRIGPICFGRSEVLEVLAEQLAHYFSSMCTSFAVSIVQRGSVFQAAVWAALGQIPLGQTRTYGGLADVVGRPAAARVVAREWRQPGGHRHPPVIA